VAYEESLLELFRMLDIPLHELNDWNCCGATSYMSVDEGSAFVLSARNLSIAGGRGKSRRVTGRVRLGRCILAPCGQSGEILWNRRAFPIVIALQGDPCLITDLIQYVSPHWGLRLEHLSRPGSYPSNAAAIGASSAGKHGPPGQMTRHTETVAHPAF